MKDKILELRKKGFSFSQISKELSCAKSTISYHCKKFGLSDIGLDEIKRIKRGTKICENCGNEFSLTGIRKEQKFCNKECYNKSDNLKNSGRKFGLKSSQSQKETRRSRNEIYFFELCKEKYNEVLNNEAIFNGWDADVIITKYKVAVLWNGKWHYEKLTKKHSVEQVKNRDRIKVKEIESCGYHPYIIKDMGRENKNFVEEEFKKLTGYISSLS
jgi:IS30 family transposase